MKIICLIFIVCFSKCDGQDYAKWKTNKEFGVLSYEVQSSNDKKNWTTVATIQPLKKDTNTYAYDLQKTNTWYRVKANMINATFKFYTDTLFLKKNSLNYIKVSENKIIIK